MGLGIAGIVHSRRFEPRPWDTSEVWVCPQNRCWLRCTVVHTGGPCLHAFGASRSWGYEHTNERYVFRQKRKSGFPIERLGRSLALALDFAYLRFLRFSSRKNKLPGLLMQGPHPHCDPPEVRPYLYPREYANHGFLLPISLPL